MLKCPNCGSNQAAKAGLVDRSIQRYRCKECGRKYKDAQIAMKKKFDELCNKCIFDSSQRDIINKFLFVLKELKMNPTHYHNTSYKCHYKNFRVVYIDVSDHLFRIKVCTMNHTPGSIYDNAKKMHLFIELLPIEIKNEFMRLFKKCTGCTTCKPGYDFKIGDELFENICEKCFYYKVENPSIEQLDLVIKFINARRNYIANYLI